MKDYLKREVTSDEIAVAVALYWLSGNIDTVIKTNRTGKHERTDLKYILTYSRKYIEHLRESLSDKSFKKLQSKVKNYRIHMDAVDTKNNPRISILRDDLLDFAAEALDVCCKGCDGLKKKCSIRDVMTECVLPPLEPSINKPCQYMFTEEDLRGE